MRVNFLIAGTQKGGTTALYYYLRDHPDLSLSVEKETHFFDTEEYFVGQPNYDRLHAFFSPKPGQFLGEATPITMYWHDAPRRVWEYSCEMKIICMLRNPISRAFSHWNMERNRNADSLSFADAISNEALRCREALPLQHRVYSYIDRGFYAEQIRRLWRFFPHSQTLFIPAEQLDAEPERTLNAIYDFLGIARRQMSPHRMHVAQYDSRLCERMRCHLRDLFAPDIREVERLLNWDCSHWLQ
jgi:hypothetical protein